MGDYRFTREELSKLAVETINGPDNQTEAGELVNLGVKVPLSWRRHWAAESKRAGISMTEIIIDALIKRLGKPE